MLFTIRKYDARRAARFASTVVALAGLSSQAMAGSPSGFDFTDFSSIAGLALNGHAVQTGNVIDINGVPQRGASVGSFWHVSQQNIALGFTTNFSFRIADVNGAGGGGFAFSIHNSNSGPSGTASFGTSALGASGGALGYGSNMAGGGTNPGINRSFNVEFDTFYNPLAAHDFPGDHVAVHVWDTVGQMPVAANSIAHALPAMGSGWENISDGQIYDVRIQYVPGFFEMFIKRSTDAFFGPAILSENFDLSVLVPLAPGPDSIGQAWVGFTAGTGAIQDFERHQILSWDFAGVIPAPGAMAVLMLGGVVGLRRRR